jgi:hypothetical protein
MLALNFAESGGRSVGIVRLRTEGHGACLSVWMRHGVLYEDSLCALASDIGLYVSIDNVHGRNGMREGSEWTQQYKDRAEERARRRDRSATAARCIRAVVAICWQLSLGTSCLWINNPRHCLMMT